MDVTSQPKRENSLKSLPLIYSDTPVAIAFEHNTSSFFVVSIQLSLGGVFKKRKKMDESCPEGPEYSSVVTLRCACYNAGQFCFHINLLFLPSFNAYLRANTLPIM